MLPIDKLEQLCRRYVELDELLCQPQVLADRNQLSKLNRERIELEPVVQEFFRYREVDKQVVESEQALSDPELRGLAEQELAFFLAEREKLSRSIQMLLLPTDPRDKKNTILEIRSGEGGEEAALFAADLFRMYVRYAEAKGWIIEILSMSESVGGGYKEIVALVSGKDVYSHLRFEGGVHRVQRVPLTETQGRIHTSTATVAVLPEAEEVDVQIDEKDLEYSIAASGGPGGQGVNTTNSAVQVLHKPSGILVKCQDERSQIKNKAKALKVLRSRLLEIECQQREAQLSAERRSMVSTGERSQKIRTYNYPQNRVRDHRIQLSLNKDRVIEGELDELITSLRTHHQAALLQGETADFSEDIEDG
ncbi:peptide chain release factor 1 [Pajaroellobacter abortibovis]|uniref:Peptide chain release factor 1 n=1 Tax=Pajaroellobacter abortibovis TaxID=1882918 RepID=A0A1L6MVR3_9BACT|nr:peptide chain release factor 1 [Pajaroellobacter abortibovis]APR99564.1 peptide chain release factor 1 [Pajaroellobacter abortibovis]